MIGILSRIDRQIIAGREEMRDVLKNMRAFNDVFFKLYGTNPTEIYFVWFMSKDLQEVISETCIQ